MSRQDKPWRLKIQGADQDLPRLISLFVKKSDMGEIAYKQTPGGPGILVCAKPGEKFLATFITKGEAPVRPTDPAEVSVVVKAIRDIGPTESREPVHRGTWSGTMGCSEGHPVVTLTRKVASYLVIEVYTDHTPGWHVRVQRRETWFAPAAKKPQDAAFHSLEAAINVAYQLATSEAGIACAVRDTVRREAVDKVYGQTKADQRAQREAAKPTRLHPKPEDATVDYVARVPVPTAWMKMDGYSAFPEAQRRMATVIGWLQANGFRLAANTLTSFVRGVETHGPKGRTLGETIKAAEKHLVVPFGGRRNLRGTNLDRYNQAVMMMSTLAGGVVVPELEQMQPPSCPSSVQAVQAAITAEAEALGRELGSVWATMSGAVDWTDARTAYLNRTKALIEKAWALLRSPLCVGTEKAAGEALLRRAMDLWERFAAAILGTNQGLGEAARVRLLTSNGSGVETEWVSTVLEGPHKGLLVTLQPRKDQPRRLDLLQTGGMVFAAFDPKTHRGAIAGIPLDRTVGGGDVLKADRIANLKDLTELATLAAVKAARGCATGKSSCGLKSSAAAPDMVFGGKNAANTLPVMMCERCGFRSRVAGRHIAIGSIECPAGDTEFKPMKAPTAKDEAAADSASRHLLGEGDDKGRAFPVPIAWPLTKKLLDGFPVGTVFAFLMSDQNHQLPAMVAKVGRADAQTWQQFDVFEGATKGPIVSAQQVVDAAKNFSSGYQLAEERDPVRRARVVTAALKKLPNADRWKDTAAEVVDKRAARRTTDAAREAMEGKPYAAWGRDTWSVIGDAIKGKDWTTTARNGIQHKTMSVGGPGKSFPLIKLHLRENAKHHWSASMEVRTSGETFKVDAQPGELLALNALAALARAGGLVQPVEEPDEPSRRAPRRSASTAAPGASTAAPGASTAAPDAPAPPRGRRPRQVAPVIDAEAEARIAEAVGSALDQVVARLQSAGAQAAGVA